VLLLRRHPLLFLSPSLREEYSSLREGDTNKNRRGAPSEGKGLIY